MPTFREVRSREAGYHNAFYARNNIGEGNSWVTNPATYVIDSFDLIPDRDQPRVLDLGCGIGRHAIAVAEHLGSRSEVVGVDLLPSAINKMNANAVAKGVESSVTGIVCDVDTYEPEGQFDGVLSVSCIEHLPSEERLKALIDRLQNATSINGLHCFMMATSHRWRDESSGKAVEPLVEMNLSVEETLSLLDIAYESWEIHDLSTAEWEERESVRGRPTICSSTCVQFRGTKRE